MDHRRIRLLLLLIVSFFYSKSKGQIINSTSPDKTGMYYYAIDSLISIAKSENTIEKVILIDKRSPLNNFPETINGVNVEIADDKFKPKKLKDNQFYILVSGLSIIKDQVSLNLFVFWKHDGNLSPFDYGIYQFKFLFNPSQRNYYLRSLEMGYNL